eukprot:jgi/Mesen1/9904/ME000070S09189
MSTLCLPAASLKLVNQLNVERSEDFSRHRILRPVSVRVITKSLRASVPGLSSRCVLIPQKWKRKGGRVLATASAEEVTSGIEDVPARIEDVSAGTEGAPETKVKFVLKKQCSFGQSFHVCGESDLLGQWQSEDALPLTWSEGHIWTGEVDLPSGTTTEFKYILKGKHGEVMWQPGENHVIETTDGATVLEILEELNWEERPTILTEEQVSVADRNVGNKSNRLASSASVEEVNELGTGSMEVSEDASSILEGAGESKPELELELEETGGPEPAVFKYGSSVKAVDDPSEFSVEPVSDFSPESLPSIPESPATAAMSGEETIAPASNTSSSTEAEAEQEPLEFSGNAAAAAPPAEERALAEAQAEAEAEAGEFEKLEALEAPQEENSSGNWATKVWNGLLGSLGRRPLMEEERK